ncbi:MAG: response regulator [Paenibacillus sp.]|jgi:two-component system sensor histidine kinase ChiS|nr:response regulator [Paenibacillus sp.]
MKRPEWLRWHRGFDYAVIVLVVLAGIAGFTQLVNGGLTGFNAFYTQAIELEPGWEAAIGDVPVSDGRVIDEGAVWKPYEELMSSPEGLMNEGVFWVRRTIPEFGESYRDPMIRIRDAKQYQLFIDKTQIADFNWEHPTGWINPTLERNYYRIPVDYKGLTLHMRVIPQDKGLYFGQMVVVEAYNAVVQSLRLNLLIIVLLVCFLFLGFISFAAYLLYNKEALHGLFALLNFCAGYSCFARSSFTAFLNTPLWIVYFHDITLPLGTFAFYGLLGQLAAGPAKAACRTVSRIMLAYTIACFALALVDSRLFMLIDLYAFPAMLAATLLYLVRPLARWYRQRRDAETVWLAIGSGTLALSVSLHFLFIFFPQLDVLTFRYVPFFHAYWKAEFILSGMFLFVLSLGMMIVSRLRNVFRKSRELAAELRDKNRRLESMDRIKDDFLANTSHELRTPLHGMIGLAESLLDGVSGPLQNAARRNLELIAASGKRLSRLVNDILDLVKIKHRDIPLHKQTVHLRDAAGIVLAAFGPVTGGKQVRLVNRIAADLPQVAADPDRLQQVLYNLIGNSVKFTLAGEIAVSALREGDWIRITVADTGIGIPEDKLTAVFEPFEQVGEIAATLDGTGLGLPLTKKLVELHGGTIGIRSAPGKGTECTFTLPVADTADKPPHGSDSPALAVRDTTSGGERAIGDWAPDRSGMRSEPPEEVFSAAADVPAGSETVVLLVDDEPVNHQVLDNYLFSQPFRLMKAYSAKEALQLLELHDIDLVLLDVMLPDGNGYDICRTIRLRHPASELPVIMLTAKNRLADLLEGFEAGTNDYLTKPFSKNELLARVNVQLQLSRLTHSLERLVQERTADLERTNRQLQESMRETAQAMAELQVAEDRNRIAGDIHDIVGHTLTTTIVQLEAAKRLLLKNDDRGLEKLELSQSLVRRSMDEIRESVQMMRQNGADYDLETALGRLMEQTAHAAALEMEYEICPLPPLGVLHKKVIYHALQEGLTNGIRHGECSRFRFELDYRDERVRFSLWNDGKKYNPGGTGMGIGLRVMTERVKSLGGSLELSSPGAEGCLLILSLPTL